MRFVIAASLTALGFWVGWGLAAERSASPTADREASSPASSSPLASPAIETDEAAPTDALEATRDPAPTLAPPPMASEIAAELLPILEQFPRKEYETGEGVITGHVTDENGAPIAGIGFDLIVIGTTPDVVEKGVGQPTALGYVLEQIDQYHFDLAHLRHAVSGEDGTFTFEAVSPDHEYNVESAPTNDRAVLFERSRGGLAAGDEVIARAWPAAPVTIEVVTDQGHPVRTSWLSVWGEIDGDTRSRALSYRGAPLEVRLPIAFSKIHTRSMRGGTAFEEELDLRVGEAKSFRLVITEDASVTLRLAMADDPVERFGLSARVIDLSMVGEIPEDLDLWADEGRSIPLGPGQRMRRAVSSGEYLVLLVRDAIVLDHRTVEVVSGDLEVEFTVPPVDRRDLAIVSVLSPEGHPVEEVSFDCVVSRGDSSGRWQYPIEGSHLGSGQFAVRFDRIDLSSSLQPLGLVGVNSIEFGREEIPLSFGTGEVFELQFDPPASLTVELLGYVGHELQGNASVIVRRRGELLAVEESDSTGVVEFEGLSPGPVLLGLSPILSSTFLGESVALELQPGENRIALPLPLVSTVTLRFPTEYVGSFVSLTDREGESAAEWIGGEGIAEFAAIEPGRYTVEPERALEAMVIDVPTVQPIIDYRPKAADVLRVHVHDETGTLAQVGFRAGDIVTSVDGSRAGSLQELHFQVLQAIGSGSSEIEVERAGGILTLFLSAPLDPRVWSTLGGEFIPESREGGR